jgi:hypothetical protein
MLKTSRRSKKYNDKCTGLYINNNVFHVSLLDCDTPTVGDQPSSEAQTMIVEHKEKWEINRILDSRQPYRKLQYLIQCASFNHIRTSYEQAEHFENGLDMVDVIHP